ncbi:hypothetical protein Sango_2406300 [Sesamum angolense]|uniref:UBA domain-containing protein n=1 Tax=Sesamum angolense TaxID=2727404 RepID=A0AAE1W771_9LAMI|nr:hypothetical protein Sango_2406300 [Sesamum angolense]
MLCNFRILTVASGFSYLFSYEAQESDLHTKRTGHTEFVDKTSEAAKPISLEAPKPEKDLEMEEAGGDSSSQQEEMIVPEVNQQLLSELEEMGFPKERATRALHFSGDESNPKYFGALSDKSP